MKAFATLILVAISTLALAQENTVRVIQNDRVIMPVSPELASRLIAFVESSTVNSTREVDQKDSWAKALSAPTRVQAHFSPALKIRVEKANQSGKTPELIEDLLFAIPTTPFPSQIQLRTSRGYQSVTKYSPCSAARFALASGLTFPNFNLNNFVEQSCKDRK
jgi:hypothetical protein